MSHNHAGHVPYITAHTSALSEAGAGKTLTITGFGLSLATTVAIPAALGVETSRSYTKASSTVGTLTITLTVEAIPASPVSRSIAISQGGTPCQGPDVTAGSISVNHGWTPAVLCTGTHDYWWNPDTLSLSDGDNVASFADSVNGLAMTEGTTAAQPTFKDSTYVWSGSKTAAAIVATDSTNMADTAIPLKETGGVVTACTVAVILKDPTNPGSGSSWRCLLGPGGDDTAKRFAIGLAANHVRVHYPGGFDMHSTAEGSWVGYTSGGIITPILTASGGSGSITIPEMSIDETFSYTEAASSTSGPYFGYKPAYLGEVLVLSKELTASEITQLRSYWANKYGS